MKRVIFYTAAALMMAGSVLTGCSGAEEMADVQPETQKTFRLSVNASKGVDTRTLTDAEIPPTPEGLHYYLLLCSDRDVSSAEAPGNTDGIMLAALDTTANRVMLISIVRDLLVLRPDGQYGRINGIGKRFSLEDTARVISSHFGIRVEKYVLVNWKGVANIIDLLGGVEVTLTR